VADTIYFVEGEIVNQYIPTPVLVSPVIFDYTFGRTDCSIERSKHGKFQSVPTFTLSKTWLSESGTTGLWKHRLGKLPFSRARMARGRRGPEQQDAVFVPRSRALMESVTGNVQNLPPSNNFLETDRCAREFFNHHVMLLDKHASTGLRLIARETRTREGCTEELDQQTVPRLDVNLRCPPYRLAWCPPLRSCTGSHSWVFDDGLAQLSGKPLCLTLGKPI